MWAEQVSTSDDHVEDNIVKAEVSGYAIEDPVAEQDEPGNVELTDPPLVEPSTVIEPDVHVDTHPPVEESAPEEVSVDDIPPESSPVAFPTSGSEEAVTTFTETPAGDATPTRLLDPVAAAPLVAEPLAFPTVDKPLPEPVASPTPGPAVTFEASVPPSRTGTPDPDSEHKRKRISSQNFQRLARRISITTRRSSLIIPGIPGLKKDSSKASTEDTGNDSGSGSMKGDTVKSKPKKEKKEKEQKS